MQDGEAARVGVSAGSVRLLYVGREGSFGDRCWLHYAARSLFHVELSWGETEVSVAVRDVRWWSRAVLCL